MDLFQHCQSCGMPMKMDPGKGGTNTDGTKSDIYCSNCYVEGQFTQPDFTVEDMTAFVKDKMSEMNFPKFLVGYYSNQVSKLGRWEK